MEYIAEEIVSSALKEDMRRVLSLTSPIEETRAGGVILTLTVKFSNGFEADVKVVNGSEDCGPWGEVVLFDEEGYEVSCTEPCLECLEGETVFECDYDTYKIIVR